MRRKEPYEMLKQNKKHSEQELEKRRHKTRLKNKYSEQIKEPYLALK